MSRNPTRDGPITSGVFYCPSGVSELLVIAGSPSAAQPGIGTMGIRFNSTVDPNISVDTWYGINGCSDPANVSGGAGYAELPCRRIPVGTDWSLTKMSHIRKPSELVFLFDGLYMNHTTVDPYRINGRHNFGTLTNILFFDGHAASVPRKGIPTATTDFTLTNLAKFPAAKWRVDQ
jgi:prepilin-type processing-associated H-X9-DG protein